VVNNNSKVTKSNSNGKSNNNVSGTKEWAGSNVNFIDGCKHDCKYCYAKAATLRHKRKTPATWSDEVIRYDRFNKGFGKRGKTIMFPSVHDIHPDHLSESLDILGRMLVKGNRVLIVSKPHEDCIRAICRRFSKYRDNILFRFTIGSANSFSHSYPGISLDGLYCPS